MSKPKSDAEKLMAEQMKHAKHVAEELDDVFDLRMPAEQTLERIADNWRRAEDNAVARFKEDYPDANDLEVEVLRQFARHEIRLIAMGYRDKEK